MFNLKEILKEQIEQLHMESKASDSSLKDKIDISYAITSLADTLERIEKF